MDKEVSTKESILNMINGLESFLNEIENLQKHPYSQGINVERMLEDMKKFTTELKTEVNKLEDIKKDES
jgi:hypothetical protein